MKLLNTPVVVPLGYHCAPTILNDILGFDAATRPKGATPFGLGVFPPRSIARLFKPNQSASSRHLAERLCRVSSLRSLDGASLVIPEDAERSSGFRKISRFGHDVAIRHADLGIVLNHDFVTESSNNVSTDIGTLVIMNHGFILKAYEKKFLRMERYLQGDPFALNQHNAIFLTIATPTILRCGTRISVPSTIEQVCFDVRCALSALSTAYNGIPQVTGAVVLVGPDTKSESANVCSSMDEIPKIVVGRLSREALHSLKLYGETPLPKRAPLYKEVYEVFVRCAKKLHKNHAQHDWPPWENTQYYQRCVAPTIVMAKTYKTRMCRFFSGGNCHFGAKCRYAHDESELRNRSIDDTETKKAAAAAAAAAAAHNE